MSANKVNKNTNVLFIYFALLAILFLTAVNINSVSTQKEDVVLGAKTEITDDVFWKNFLDKNPEYIPGWIEIGRMNKANEIDPNYIKP